MISLDKIHTYLQNIFSPCLTEAEEGITGYNTKKREGFNRMVEDALAGRIEMKIA